MQHKDPSLCVVLGSHQLETSRSIHLLCNFSTAGLGVEQQSAAALAMKLEQRGTCTD